MEFFTISPTKTFNPPSVSPAMGAEAAHNISGLSSQLGHIQSVMRYHQIDTPQPYTPSNQQQYTTSPPKTQQEESPQQSSQTYSSNIHSSPSRPSPPVPISPFQDYCCLKVLFRTTADLNVLLRTSQIYQKQLTS